MHEQVVRAAQAGDQRALEELLAACLPLLYNIVGRSLRGHSDVDDVVQEALLRAVNGLGTLREPERFRSWLVTITMRQIRSHLAAARPERPTDHERLDTADPGADFEDLTIVRLGLSGQRRQTAEASRWLDPGDRDLLSLWWLEAAGELTRAELAAGFELTPQHAAVRVQRMKAQLDGSRVVVRALAATPRCPDLAQLAGGWDGVPAMLWRKRFVRHTRECSWCERFWTDLVPAEALLAGLGLVPLPEAGLRLPALRPSGSRTFRRLHRAGTGHGPRNRWAVRFSARPLLVVSTVASLGAVSVGAVYALTPADHQSESRLSASAPPQNSPMQAPAALSSPRAAPVTATPKPSPSTTHPSVTATPLYGSVVDRADSAPAADRIPGALPVRSETQPITIVTAQSKYESPFKGSLGGRWLMFYRGDHITVTGRGYFQVRWEVAFFNRTGLLRMPTWTSLSGKLFHAASGGGRRMDDTVPGATDLPHTWMGDPEKGYIVPPAGAQQMWNNEFFYLDGTVTLNENEIGADYNLSVTPVTRAQIQADITRQPGQPGIVRYGIVRDTGTDAAPVPQYLTRAAPAVPWDAPQQSAVVGR